MATQAKQTPTVRISEKSHTTLRELSAKYDEPMQSVLDQALESYRRKKFFDECDAAYAALQQQPEAWADYQRELALWEVTLMANPAYGEVCYAELDPTVGHERTGRRPVLVISVDRFNASPPHLAVVLPITSTWRGVPCHVPVAPHEGGLTHPSAILCEAIRSISHDRLEQSIGKVGPQTMQAVHDRLRALFQL